MNKLVYKRKMKRKEKIEHRKIKERKKNNNNNKKMCARFYDGKKN